jgi:hypothetical protein
VRSHSRPRCRGAAVAAGFGFAALALPATAAAHGRGAIVALDYRLRLDAHTRALPGVRVWLLDGDRDLRVTVEPGVNLLVRGELGEALLRVDADGVWINASSPTATSDGLISPRLRGWVHVSGSRSVSWHEHRLAPPPTSSVGPDGGFSIPIVLDGRPNAIAGSFYRVARPALWPWLLAGAALLAAIAAAARARGLRRALILGLGAGGGLAALVATATFAARDAPTGGVGWLEIATGCVLGAVLGGLLVVLRGRARIHAAGLVGAMAAAVSLSSTPVFWHGVVISVLPAALARLVCGLALVFGGSAAALSFLRDLDAPPRPARR